jgi:hypothetical protein
MKLHVSASLLLLLTLTWSTPAQTSQLTPTYGDTLKMLQSWADGHNNVDLGRLFTIGDERASDLRAACHGADNKIASRAFFVLQLFGKTGCLDCGNSISRKHKGFAFVCEADLTEVDFKRIEEWLAKKRTQKGYECGDDTEWSESLGDSLVFALILEGSPRSKSILNRLLAMDKACGWNNIIGEPLEQAQTLIKAAKEVGHNMKFEPDTLEDVIRACAFFLPPEHRKESRVNVIAHNKTGDRILLEVAYMCGLLCGRGYIVVVRKNGTTWQYALITMLWIS